MGCARCAGLNLKGLLVGSIVPTGVRYERSGRVKRLPIAMIDELPRNHWPTTSRRWTSEYPVARSWGALIIIL